jgi:predicted TIM-barrel fold metal-dependent hydrolase
MSEHKPPRIDVHHHPVLPSHLGHLGRNSANPAALRNWSVGKSLDDMDQGGIGAAILSVPYPPDTWGGDAGAAAKLAREANEFMAQLARDHRGRFGVFATLPIDHIDDSLAEAAHALDTLGADGIGIMTNIGDKWLGDPHYAPLFGELDRRKAVVFVHPAAPYCCTNLVPDLPDTMIEFATDTARAIARLVFSGSAARYPGIRFIFSHGGGTMPFIAERFLRMPSLNPALKQAVPNGVLDALQRFYYELAQASHRSALAALMPLVPMSQLLFGTDFPFRGAAEHLRLLAEFGWGENEIDAVARDNAARLLPKAGAMRAAI